MNYNKTQLSFIEAYQTTKYHVFESEIIIEIGKVSEPLNELLKKNKATNWAFITSINPYSKVLTEQENELRFNSLINDIYSYSFYDGEGVGENPEWLPEKSVLIIDITIDKAIDLGDKYEQNAIVTGKFNEPASLILLNAFEQVGN